MGPPSDNGGYAATQVIKHQRVIASMGPPSDNGGYVGVFVLQRPLVIASMGPPSDNGGYDSRWSGRRPHLPRLQWVHRPITVVMPGGQAGRLRAQGQASMGPPSDNGGYVGSM